MIPAGYTLQLRTVRDLPESPGVYIISRHHQPLYVGQTNSLKPRMRGHRQKLEIKGTRVYFREIADHNDRAFEEFSLIASLSPSMNRNKGWANSRVWVNSVGCKSATKKGMA